MAHTIIFTATCGLFLYPQLMNYTLISIVIGVLAKQKDIVGGTLPIQCYSLKFDCCGYDFYFSER